MSVTLLTEHHLEFLSLTEGYTGLSESTLAKMPHCWKSHVVAQIGFYFCGVVIDIVIILCSLSSTNHFNYILNLIVLIILLMSGALNSK